METDPLELCVFVGLSIPLSPPPNLSFSVSLSPSLSLFHYPSLSSPLPPLSVNLCIFSHLLQEEVSLVMAKQGTDK